MSMSKKIFLSATYALLMILFIYAATSKLLDYHTFVVKLGRDPFIGHYASAISIVLPVVEIVTAVLLAIPAMQRIGLWLSLTIMSAFTIYVALVLTIAPQIPCTCGGFIQAMTWNQHLIFNIAFVLLASLAIILTKPAASKSDPAFSPKPIGSI